MESSSSKEWDSYEKANQIKNRKLFKKLDPINSHYWESLPLLYQIHKSKFISSWVSMMESGSCLFISLRWAELWAFTGGPLPCIKHVFVASRFLTSGFLLVSLSLSHPLIQDWNTKEFVSCDTDFLPRIFYICGWNLSLGNWKVIVYVMSRLLDFTINWWHSRAPLWVMFKDGFHACLKDSEVNSSCYYMLLFLLIHYNYLLFFPFVHVQMSGLTLNSQATSIHIPC